MKFIYFFLFLTWINSSFTQINFPSHYQNYPALPKGFLEAYAFTHTRFQPIDKHEPSSCVHMPQAFGILGLFDKGQGYFKENAKTVSQLSGISVQSMQQSQEMECLAFAKACDSLLRAIPKHLQKTPGMQIYALMSALSEIPKTNAGNCYAFESSVYDVLQFLQDEEQAAKFQFPLYAFDLHEIFGSQNAAVLSASQIKLNPLHVSSTTGAQYNPELVALKSADYAPALWSQAPNCNFSSRNGTAVSAVTVHTVQGSYSGAISWGLNCNAQVSYHYVVRSSDGQITQMVLET
ncbi:MAG: N-acetylmuramoyl-L-alanine amidase, partial [Flavobacteriia bacterium]|nr:N-acetylmuramoyl-L-alanine amidase [Flavobacteriia bacterium]